MIEDEVADASALGDSSDLADVGVKRGHPFEGGPGEPVPLQVAEVGHLVDEYVGTLGERHQIVVDGSVARKDDRAVAGVEAERESWDGVAVHDRHCGDLDGSIFEDDQRSRGVSV